MSSAKVERERGKTPVKPPLTYPLGDPPPAGDWITIAPGVHWVCMPLPMDLKWINLWVLDDGDGWTLVDTGFALDETRAHWRTLYASKLDGRPIKRVIGTHMHPDHVGLAGWICRKFGAPLWMSRMEYFSGRLLFGDTGREAPEEGVRFYRAAGWDEDALDSYKVRFGQLGRLVSRLPDSLHRIRDGDEIEIGGRIWRVIVGNGHSLEHVCLWQEDLKLFISGDQVLPRISSNISVHPTEPQADPLSDWIASCKMLRARLPNDLLVLPSHNEPFRGLHERLDDLVDRHEISLERLTKRLQEGPKRAVDMFGALFARKIGPTDLHPATGEAIAHANCLITRGLARRVWRDGVIYYEAT